MSEDRQVTGTLWDALSKVYNMDGVPDEAKSIIGDVMLCLQSEEPEPEQNTTPEQPVSDRLGVKTSKTCTDTISRQAAIDAIHGRVFQGIIVEYPSYNTYPEYEGKPYFSIKYTENGQGFIGYGTYKPEVLSEYLKEYFMPYAQPDLQPTCNQLATDCISRQAAIGAVENCEPGEELFMIKNLPSVQPEYEPVTAEDFAKTMSENTLYGFMAWYGEIFTLIKEMGFVICKKTM